MTPKEAVLRLVKAGINHNAIARMLTESGQQTTQPTIYRIGTGEIVNPGFALGTAIVRLCEEKAPAKTKKRRAA
jgi:hypothetical protein